MAEVDDETTTDTRTETETTVRPWQAGVAGGLVGALGFGAMMSVMMPGVLEMAIPAMYGIEGPAGAIGWVIHMSQGAVIGVVFAAIASAGPAAQYTRSLGRSAVAGLVYGIVVWVTLAVVVMPIWLGAVGFPGAPPLPNIGVESLLGHSVYGLLLGITFGALSTR